MQKMIVVDTGIFDDEKIRLMTNREDGDELICTWFKLLTLAGKIDCGGYFYLRRDNKTPLDISQLSILIHKPENRLGELMQVYENFGIIQMDEKVISIRNWKKYQSINLRSRNSANETSEKCVEKKQNCDLAEGQDFDGEVTLDDFGLNCGCKNDDREKEKEKRNKKREKKEERKRKEPKEKERNKIKERNNKENKEKERETHTSTTSLLADEPTSEKEKALAAWNELFEFGVPRVKCLVPGSKRDRELTKLLKTFSLADVTSAMDKIKTSRFLQGKSSARNWRITFDWFVNINNFVKLVEGNYDDKKSAPDSSSGRCETVKTSRLKTLMEAQ